MFLGKYLKYIIIGLVFIFGLKLGSSYEVKKFQEQLIIEKQAHIEELNALGKRKDETINLLIQNTDSISSVKSSIDKRINSLQFHINAGNKELLQTTRRINAESVVTCRKLLSESAGLLGEGVSLLQETNRRLDATIQLHNR